MAKSKATPADDQIEENMQAPHYDRGITPAETAARQEREGASFMHTPTEVTDESAETDDQTHSDSIRTTDGYTVDKEGLIDNFAIEPEMYINEPGDLREAEAARAKARAGELQDINDNDETGKLTMENDRRGKGSGII